MPEVDLSKYARHPQVPCVGDDGRIYYRPALTWAKLLEDGTIYADVRDEPEEGTVYPPLEECDGRKCYRRWLERTFILYPNYEIEEIRSERDIIVRRSDGVRFWLAGRLYRALLLELAKYPNGIELFEFLPLALGWMAAIWPERFRDADDKTIAKEAEVAVGAIGVLYYEYGLIDLKEKKG